MATLVRSIPPRVSYLEATLLSPQLAAPTHEPKQELPQLDHVPVADPESDDAIRHDSHEDSNEPRNHHDSAPPRIHFSRAERPSNLSPPPAPAPVDSRNELLFTEVTPAILPSLTIATISERQTSGAPEAQNTNTNLPTEPDTPRQSVETKSYARDIKKGIRRLNLIRALARLTHRTPTTFATESGVSVPRASTSFVLPAVVLDTEIGGPAASAPVAPTAPGTSLPTVTSPRTSIHSSIAPIRTVPVDSPHIYRWSTKASIYLGRLKDVQIPPEILDEWTMNIRDKIHHDLTMVARNLPRSLPRDKKMWEAELCMVGEADPDADTVDLKPTVWIRCGGKECKKLVLHAVHDLEYLRTFSRGRVQVHRGAPLPAGCIPHTYCDPTPTFGVPLFVRDNSAPQTGGPHLSTGAIVGISLGSSMALGLFLFCCCCCCRDADCFSGLFKARGRSARKKARKKARKERKVISTHEALVLPSTIPEMTNNYQSSPSLLGRPRSFVFEAQGATANRELTTIPPIQELNWAGGSSFVGGPSQTFGSALANRWRSPYLDGRARVNVLNSSSTSAIGLKASFLPSMEAANQKNPGSLSERYNHDLERISTIGGLLKVGGTIYGLTAAHAAMEVSDLLQERAGGSTLPDSASGSSDSDSEIQGIDCSDPRPGSMVAYGVSHERYEWTKGNLGPASYGRQPIGSDFALIGLDEVIGGSGLANAYYHPDCGQCTVDEIGESPHAGSVDILCSPYDVRRGYLLDGDAAFADGETVFRTKKIQTEIPLERGLSGVWVLQQLRLIGIIVAVYEREPYAHMLQISQIVCDIKNSVCLPARASSPDLEVELPKTSTGELLSASKKDSEDG